ncbi:hypothetical protein JCM8097_001470 [Rhodosporidiobolus ruineniae]
MAALTMVTSRSSWRDSRISFEAEDVDDLLDLTAWMRSEDRRGGGDGKGYFGSSTLRMYNLPFPTAPRHFPPPFPTKQAFASPAFSSTVPGPFPSTPFAARRASRNAHHPLSPSSADFAKRSHRRSVSSPDALAALTLHLPQPPPSSYKAPSAYPSSLPFPSPVRTAFPRSSALPPPSPLPFPPPPPPSAALVRRGSKGSIASVFSHARPETPLLPPWDLSSTAALLREAEVAVELARRGSVQWQSWAGEAARREEAERRGREVKVDGVVFGVLPVIVVEQGVAV